MISWSLSFFLLAPHFMSSPLITLLWASQLFKGFVSVSKLSLKYVLIESCIASCIAWLVSKAALSLQLKVVGLGELSFKVIAVGAWSDNAIVPISALTTLIKSLCDTKIRSILEYHLWGGEK